MPGSEEHDTFDEFGVAVEIAPAEETETPPEVEPEPDEAAPASDATGRTSGTNGLMPDHVDLPTDVGLDSEDASDTVRELRETKERLLRLAADFDNFRKRQERERHEHTRFANERLLRELLPVIDNLERAQESARRSGEAPAIVAGLELLIQEFHRVIQRAGAEPIPALGKPFDPALHEALQQMETDQVDPGCVAAEILRGYTLNGRVIRPTLVAVATAPEITSPGMKALDIDPS